MRNQILDSDISVRPERMKIVLTDIESPLSAGNANFFNFTIDLDIYSSNVETCIHEIGHMIHFAFHSLTTTTYNPNEVFFNAHLFNEDFDLSEQSRRLSLCATKYPGLVSPYSLTNNEEQFAESFASYMLHPADALKNYFAASSPEHVLKFISVMQMLKILSGGLMGKSYFQDLSENKVSDKYWQNVDVEEFYHVDAGQFSVFTTDLSPWPEEYFPASVSVVVKKSSEVNRESLISGNRIPVNIFGLKDVFLELQPQLDEVFLEVGGVRLSFCALPSDSQAQIRIYGVETESEFVIKRDGMNTLHLIKSEYRNTDLWLHSNENRSLNEILFYLALGTVGGLQLFKVFDKRENGKSSSDSESRLSFTRRAFLVNCISLVLTGYSIKKFFDFKRLERFTDQELTQEWYEDRGPFIYACKELPTQSLGEVGVVLKDVDSAEFESKISGGVVHLTNLNSFEKIMLSPQKDNLMFSFQGDSYTFSKKLGFFILSSELEESNTFSKIITVDSSFAGNMVFVFNYINRYFHNVQKITFCPDINQKELHKKTVVRNGVSIQVLDSYISVSTGKSCFKFQHLDLEKGSFIDSYYLV